MFTIHNKLRNTDITIKYNMSHAAENYLRYRLSSFLQPRITLFDIKTDFSISKKHLEILVLFSYYLTKSEQRILLHSVSVFQVQPTKSRDTGSNILSVVGQLVTWFVTYYTTTAPI